MRIILALLIVFAAILPRIAYVNDSAEAPVFSDMQDYLQTAANFAQGNGVITDGSQRAYRAPVYPILMGFCLKGVAPSILSLRYLQAFLGAISCGLLFYLANLLGEQLMPNRPRNCHALLFRYVFPFLVGLIFAFYDSHIFFTGVLMTETLFTFLLIAWLIVLVALFRHPHVALVALAGAFLGVLALTRPGSIFYLPVLLTVLWLCSASRRQRWFWANIAMVSVVATILPWTIRNALVLDAFIPLTTNGGVNFYVGHNEYFGYSSAKKKEIRDRTAFGEVEESKYFFDLGLKFIREHPFRDINNTFVKLLHVYTTRYKPFPWTYGRKFSSPFPTVGWSMPLLSLGLIGLVVCSFRSKSFAGVIGGTIALHTATCMLFFGRTRFRVPLEPLLILATVFGVGILGLVIAEQVRTRQSRRTGSADRVSLRS